MAKFMIECKHNVTKVVKQLENTLGPGECGKNGNFLSYDIAYIDVLVGI